MEISTLNSDGTPNTCPHGAFINYPVGTIKKVHVGDAICWQCPLNSISTSDFIECTYKQTHHPPPSRM